MSRLILPTILLTLIYALVLASFDPWDLGFGAVLALGLQFGIRRLASDERLAPPPGTPRRAFAFFPFAGAVAVDILVNTWRMAAFVLRPRPAERPGIVEVPIGERSPIGVAVSALVICIAPGSTVLEIDWRRHVLVLHVLDARDPDGVRAQLREFYDRYQRHIFP